MFIFPYRIEAGHNKSPIVTLLVVIACLGIYSAQYFNDKKIDQTLIQFCQQEVKSTSYYFEGNDTKHKESVCRQIFLQIYSTHSAIERQRVYDIVLETVGIRDNNIVNEMTGRSPMVIDLFRNYLDRKSLEFATLAPKNYITAKMWFYTGSFDLVRMVSSAFAHVSWWHVLANLYIFFVFASTVEGLLGKFGFIALFLAIAVGSNTIDSLIHLNSHYERVSLGLSGVVWGMMSFTVMVIPRVKVKCVLWLVVYLTTFTLPVLAIGIAYAGMDVLRIILGDGSGNINYVVHFGGAVVGLLIAWWVRDSVRQRLSGYNE